MSVYQNTLNAYAGKLKAQRKAQARLAQDMARAKSTEQKEADRARIAEQRLLKQQNQTATATDVSKHFVDLIIRKIKMSGGDQLLAGERAKITRDVAHIAELYFYTGTIPGGVARKVVDTTGYSKQTFATIVSVLLNMGMVEEAGATDVLLHDMRTIVCFRTNEKTAVTFVNPRTQTVEAAKEKFLEDCRKGVIGVTYVMNT